MSTDVRRLSVFLIIAFLAALSLPLFARAQTNLAATTNAQCTQRCLQAAAQDPPQPCPSPTRITCKVKTVVGLCQVIGCVADSYTGLNGKSTGVGDIGGIVTGIFKGLLDKLMQQKPSGGGGGGGAPGTQASQCPNGTYTVTIPTGDPCARYIQPTSSSLLGSGTESTATSQLLQALGGTTQSSVDASLGTPSVSEQITQGNTNTSNTGSTPSSATITSTGSTPPVSPGLAGQSVNLQSGTQGNIVTTDAGVTVIANAVDIQGNSTVAGFYGSDTFGAQPTGIVGKLCLARPWAGSAVSFVIPPSFFDSLCAWRGYKVGTPAPAPTAATTVVVQQISEPKGTSTSAAAPAAPTVPPEVDIWAVPLSVPLGARTSIFWNTKGVSSCTETSPDGSFNQNSLSGGASTVPITGATTFTISCLTPDGKPVTAYVTVNLSI